jgi:cytochrome c-type biogenesis protein CcmH/NrfG
MDGKKVTIVAIIAILVGLLVGYLMWGAQTKTLQGELDQLKARLAEAQKAATREKELSAKLAQMEAQLKQVSDDLAKEKARREQMQAVVSKGKK